MARRIWHGEFARFWFGFDGGVEARIAAGRARLRRDRAPAAGKQARKADPPLGIVERNRLARREKWALRNPGAGASWSRTEGR